MAFKVTELLENFSSGFARNSLFEAWFVEDNALKFNIMNVNLPGRSIITDTFQHSPELPVVRPISTSFSPVSFTAILDQDANAINYLRGKLESTVTTAGDQYFVKYPTEYLSTLKIRQYKNDGSPMDEITLEQAYILHLGDVQLSWADSNSISTVNVTMQYRKWS